MRPKGNFLVISFYFSTQIKWAFVQEVFNDIHIFLAKCVNKSLPAKQTPPKANFTSPSFKWAGKDPHPANSFLIGLCCKKQLKLKAGFLKNVHSVYVSVCVEAYPATPARSAGGTLAFQCIFLQFTPSHLFLSHKLTSCPGFLCKWVNVCVCLCLCVCVM